MKLHQHRHFAKPAKKGFFAVTVMVFLAILTLAVVSFSSVAVNKALLNTENRMAENARLALDEIEDWYRRNHLDVAGSNTALSEDELLAILHNPYPGLRMAMSDPIRQGTSCNNASFATAECVPTRLFAAWYPSTEPTSAIDIRHGIDYGAFGGNAVWSVRDTRLWDIEQFARSEKQLDEVGNLLRSWMRSRQMADKKTMFSVNWWRDPSCSPQRSAVFLPCVNLYNELRSTPVPEFIGVASADTRTPYGWIEFSNQEDANLTPPYSIALRLRTPWGQYIQKRVAQPS